MNTISDFVTAAFAYLYIYFYVWIPIIILAAFGFRELIPYMRLACWIRRSHNLKARDGSSPLPIREVDLTILQAPRFRWLRKLFAGDYGNPYSINWVGIAAEINNLQREIGPAPRVVVTKHRKRAQVAQLLSTICLVIGVPLLIVLKLDGVHWTWWVYVPILVFGVVFFTAGMTLRRRASRLLLPNATQLLAADIRRPVLFIRSFQDDQLTVPRTEDSKYSFLNVSLPLEEAIADKLHGFGPLVAIGRPDDEYPNVGASRFYFSNEEWQGEVSELIQESSLIAMLAGGTKGLQWELEHIVANGFEKKLIILFPPIFKRGRRRAALIEMRRSFLRRLNVDPQQLLLDRLIGVHIGKDAVVTLIHTTQYLESDYEMAIYVGAYGMRDSINTLPMPGASQVATRSVVSSADVAENLVVPGSPELEVGILDSPLPAVVPWFHFYSALVIFGAIVLLSLGATFASDASYTAEKDEAMRTELEVKMAAPEAKNGLYAISATFLVSGLFYLVMAITALAMGRSPAGWAWRRALIIVGLFSFLLPYSIALLCFWGKPGNRRFHEHEPKGGSTQANNGRQSDT